MPIYVVKWRVGSTSGNNQVRAGSETEAINKVRKDKKGYFKERINDFEVVSIKTKGKW